MTEHEQELVGLVTRQFGGIDVLQDIGAAQGQQNLVDLKNAGILLERHRFQAPGIGAHSDHTFGHQITGTASAQPRLDRSEAFGILVDDAEPAGVEQHDVALANFDPLLAGRPLDFSLIEGRAFIEHRNAVVGRHVQQDAPTHDRRNFFGTEFLQAADIGKFRPLEPVVIPIADADMAESIQLCTDPVPAIQDIVVVSGLGRAQTG